MAAAIGAVQQAAPPGDASWTAAAKELQQEVAHAELAQQHLAAQLQSAGHLGALAGAAQGSGLRVQVVGSPVAQMVNKVPARREVLSTQYTVRDTREASVPRSKGLALWTEY